MLGLNNGIISALSEGGMTGDTVACLLAVSTLLVKRQTRGCAVLHLPSELWVAYVKFHSSVKSLSLCLFDSKTKTVALKPSGK